MVPVFEFFSKVSRRKLSTLSSKSSSPYVVEKGNKKRTERRPVHELSRERRHRSRGGAARAVLFGWLVPQFRNRMGTLPNRTESNFELSALKHTETHTGPPFSAFIGGTVAVRPVCEAC
ncbi:hypothetical protein TWF173_005871 [Orbilia oligospora]|uniref:Uncharacterized protein n=1 Tax=Orbilia oligospora TaxID=2813651 RepID=A0A7C8VAE5_ORBOL|nr:hypothetical protein TWF970_002275 [Orbilia oligospora]KAF3313578.1 hypothetical protein TWF173_005871 [Orbilia oligospora]